MGESPAERAMHVRLTEILMAFVNASFENIARTKNDGRTQQPELYFIPYPEPIPVYRGYAEPEHRIARLDGDRLCGLPLSAGTIMVRGNMGEGGRICVTLRSPQRRHVGTYMPLARRADGVPCVTPTAESNRAMIRLFNELTCGT